MKNLVALMLAVTFSAAAASAQTKPGLSAQKPAEANPVPAAPKGPPEPAPLPVNIKIEVSITDQTGTNAPAKKVVTMIAGDRQNTNVRSSASVPVKTAMFTGPATAGGVAPPSYSYRNVTINVDARPSIVQKEPNKISVSFGLEYLPKTAGTQEEMEPGMTSWSERLSLILESGKPMVVSQAADPTSDRKITVEVTATILK